MELSEIGSSDAITQHANLVIAITDDGRATILKNRHGVMTFKDVFEKRGTVIVLEEHVGCVIVARDPGKFNWEDTHAVLRRMGVDLDNPAFKEKYHKDTLVRALCFHLERLIEGLQRLASMQASEGLPAGVRTPARDSKELDARIDFARQLLGADAPKEERVTYSTEETRQWGTAHVVVPVEDLTEIMQTGVGLPDHYIVRRVESILLRDSVRLYLAGPDVPNVSHPGSEYPALKASHVEGFRICSWLESHS